MTNEAEQIRKENTSFENGLLLYGLVGLIGFVIGGCYVGQKAYEDWSKSEAIVFRDQKDGLEKIKIITKKNTEIYLIKPQGYSNYVSIQHYKTNELGKLERKIDTEVKVK